MTKERSKAYPSLDLKVAVQKLENMARNLGSGAFNRDEAIIGMGYKGISGASQRALAALIQYGVVDRVKDSYSLSELGSSIVFPKDPEQRDKAIRDAALRPGIFSELIEQYKLQGLPEIKFLANMLTTPRYGIGVRQKDEVAHTFITSLQYAGLLEGNQVVPTDANTLGEVEVLDSKPTLTLPMTYTVRPQVEEGVTGFRRPTTTDSVGTEQGVNHRGIDWSLVVSVKATHRLMPEVRRRVQELVAIADEIADMLYDQDDKQNDGRDDNS